MKLKKTWLAISIISCFIVVFSACNKVNQKEQIQKISEARYAPDGKYMKDHYLVFHP